MNLFLFTLLPVSLVIFYLRKDENKRAHFLPVIFTGVFTGALFVAYKLLFSSLYYVPQANVFINFLYYFFTQTLIPMAVVYGLFFILAGKDTIQDRASFFFPVIAGFYSIFLPYLVLETTKPYPGFLLFVKPLLYLAMFIIIHNWIGKTIDSHPTPKQQIVNIVVRSLVMFIPAFAEAAWVVNIPAILWIIPSLAICALAALLIFPRRS